MTGLGTPDSTAVDTAPIAGSFPNNCVELNGTKALPGYMTLANTAGAYTGYTLPSPLFSTLDGVIVNPSLIMSGGLPPCFTDAVSVTFGSGSSAVTASGSSILYAGWGNYEVAGLYQVNVLIPPNAPTGTVPVTVTIGGKTTPAVNIVLVP